MSKRITVVGDVHGDKRFISALPPHSIQLGDFDLYGYQTPCVFNSPRYFVDGNHDKFSMLNVNAERPYEVAHNLFHIPRGYISGKVLFLGGGDSIDKHLRIEGISWFSDEMISREQLDTIGEKVKDKKIEVVIAHEAPHFALSGIQMPYGGKKMLTPVSLALEEIFGMVHPSLSIFGHYHMDLDFISRGCRFLCLNIGATLDIDLPIGDLEQQK